MKVIVINGKLTKKTQTETLKRLNFLSLLFIGELINKLHEVGFSYDGIECGRLYGVAISDAIAYY